MSRIRELPAEVARLVAAGEVIQRPANVVKELVENALDADATEITIELTDGGYTRLQVTDNGSGMTPEELRLCWHHHTTSKIARADDLWTLYTLGFRGEALSSVAAVADMTLRSRPPSRPRGHELHLENNTLVSEQPVGMPSGTSVLVEHLFHNVPARRKHRHSEPSELRLITNLLTHLILAYPATRFKLTHNQKTILVTEQNHLEAALSQAFGHDSLPHLLPLESNVQAETEIIAAKGWIGTPQLARRTKQHQFLTVNGRVVTDETLSATVRAAYQTLLEANMHPAFALHLQVPPPLLDANVHPQKSTIRLMESEAVAAAIHTAVRRTLTTHHLGQKHDTSWRHLDSSPYQPIGRQLKNEVLIAPLSADTDHHILQVHNLYLILETKAGILLVDQHAAHERILYERFVEQWQHHRHQAESIPLEEPVLLELSSQDRLALEGEQSTLEALGFGLEVFRETEPEWLVTAVPEIFAGRDVCAVLRGALDDLSSGPLNATLHPHTHRMLSYLACRSAIKAGEPLNPEERSQLLQQLQETTTQYTCPHGRPVMIELTNNKLEQLFHRSQGSREL